MAYLSDFEMFVLTFRLNRKMAQRFIAKYLTNNIFIIYHLNYTKNNKNHIQKLYIKLNPKQLQYWAREVRIMWEFLKYLFGWGMIGF